MALVSGCSSVETKFVAENHEVLRVVIDDTISVDDYRALQVALFETGRYEIVDRGQAWHALKREQERQHRGEADRFSDEEKFAVWKMAFGAGGVVSSHKICANKYNVYTDEYRRHCRLFVPITNASTGKLYAAVDDEQDSSELDAPSWRPIAIRLTQKLPANLSDIALSYSERMKSFRKEAAAKVREQGLRNWRTIAYPQADGYSPRSPAE